MCQNLIKYQRIVPLKNSLKQQVEHHNIQIMDSLGENPGPKCSSITVENMTKIYHCYRNVAKRYSDFKRGWESKIIY